MFFYKDLWFLDNSYPSEIVIKLKNKKYSYGSVEAAYSASMFNDPKIHLMFTYLWGDESIKKRKNLPNKIKNFNRLKYRILYDLLMQKFSIEDNAKRLISIKEKIIFESKVKEKVILWGVSKRYNENRNVLGIMLMQIRSKLRLLEKNNILHSYIYDPYKNNKSDVLIKKQVKAYINNRRKKYEV